MHAQRVRGAGIRGEPRAKGAGVCGEASLCALLHLYRSLERAITVCSDCNGEDAYPCNELTRRQKGKQQAGTGV